MNQKTNAANDLMGLMVPPDLSILETVERINSAHKRVVLVVDKETRLVGLVTDSDIRHAILNNVDFQRPVSDIMVARPITVREGVPDKEIIRIMGQTHCFQIPILDSDGKVVGIHFINDLLKDGAANLPRTAVIMAGGIGSRLAPLTENTPKPLLTVGNQPILFTVLDQLLKCGFYDLYVSLNFKAQMIRDALENESRFVDHVKFIEEDKPLGTAGALTKLPDDQSEPFLVMNGDLLTKVALEEIMNFHTQQENMVTVAVKEEQFQIPYGTVEMEGTRITALKEKPHHSVFVNSGVYAVDPLILERIPHNTFWNMTDVINDLHQAHLRVGGFPIHEYWLDVGQHDQLEKAKAEYSENFDSDGSE